MPSLLQRMGQPGGNSALCELVRAHMSKRIALTVMSTGIFSLCWSEKRTRGKAKRVESGAANSWLDQSVAELTDWTA